MKIKFLTIYAVAGVAFLAVSLWAFLSGGRSAKALRYKYKLGGIMLTAWAMISAVSCEGVIPTVTCYEPAVMCYDPVSPNYVEISVKGNSSSDNIKAGDVLEIQVESVACEEYAVKIITEDENKTVLQTASFAPGEDQHTVQYELTVGQFDYKGGVRVVVFGVYTDGNGVKTEGGQVGGRVFNLI